MKKKICYSFLLFLIPLLFFGQEEKKQVLFTVNGEPVYTQDFKRMYLKNSDIIEGEMNIETYLELYIDYALKVAEAKALNLDESPSFKNEYQKYRNQLVEKYLTETAVTDALIKEAYKRMQTAVNASHILIQVPPNASPQDTLRFYNKTLALRKKIRQGTSFETVAKKYSDDPSAQKNGGNLGWFTVLKMVYPFETAAYETKVGEISMPVRTRFGYHLIKVNDKRPAKGKVTVAHIMLIEKKDDSTFSPKERIFEIYRELQEGASFEDLAKQFSDDKSSASNGGKLKPFAPGEMNAKKFEQMAFSLEKPNQISTPFESKFGWHIIKLLKKHPIGSLKEIRNQLETKIKNDSRARLINTSLVRNLREKYGVEKNKKALRFFQKNVSNDLAKGTWKMDPAQIPSKSLVKINDEGKTYLDFASYISKKQKRISGSRNKNVLIRSWLQEFIDNFVLEYHKANLEKVNPTFAAIATEYYNGLLLFDLMEQKIWNPAKKDSLGLQDYYEKHAENYDAETLQEIRGKVVNDYQKELEKSWMKELHKKYEVTIRRKNVENLKRKF